MQRFSRRWTVFSTAVLLLFSVYALSDTFLISRVYEVVEEGSPSEEAEEQTSSEQARTAAEASVSEEDTALASPSSEITLETYRELDTTVYVATVTLAAPDSLRTAFADNVYGRNVARATSEIAEGAGAILAVDGDYYGVREAGYVLRNGVLYRDTVRGDREDLVIYRDGTFSIINEQEVTAAALLSDGAEQILSFGPALLKEGEIQVGIHDEIELETPPTSSRTAIGCLPDGRLLFVVSDGRTEESKGLSLYELAAFMKDLGAKIAYNLDGGGSSTMVYQGKIINIPTDGHSFGERPVSDIVYIAY